MAPSVGTPALVLVLANSCKRGGRCVAGWPVTRTPQGGVRLGGWIRLEVDPNGAPVPLPAVRHIRPLRCVHVPLVRPCPVPGQPENWLVDPDRPWEVGPTVPAAAVARRCDAPESLWCLPGSDRNDRVPEDRSDDVHDSLALIAPESLILIRQEGTEDRKPRAVFAYRGRRYVLSVTDPRWSERACERVPGRPLQLDPTRNRLVVSLCRPFRGHHYKVVATIIEV